MSAEWANVIVPMFLALLSAIATLIYAQVREVKTKVSVLPQIEKDIAIVMTKQETMGEEQTDLCVRVASIESVVHDHQRLAVVETSTATLVKGASLIEKDVNENLRPHVHKIANQLAGLMGKVELIAQAARIEFPKSTANSDDA